jgi:hypothetical protein
MSTLNLKELERKAWRSSFQDGILDITLGLVLFSMALSALLELRFEAGDRLLHYAIYFGFILATLAFQWAAKRYITVPRIGQVKFGSGRQVRKKKTIQVLIASVVLGLALMVSLPALQGKFSAILIPSIIFPIIFVLNVLIVFGLMAYYMDFPRLYLIALLFALPFPLNELARGYGRPDLTFYAFAVPALVVIGIGVVYLIRFIRENPVIETDNERHAS